jgi:hypothetical protein
MNGSRIFPASDDPVTVGTNIDGERFDGGGESKIALSRRLQSVEGGPVPGRNHCRVELQLDATREALRSDMASSTII